ncbi:MAG: dihydroorotate oxidase, partial [Spirochaetes bacterium]
MADLSTDYLGLRLKNPVIAGASVLTLKMETVKRIEEEGAAALVVSSLFEEQ